MEHLCGLPDRAQTALPTEVNVTLEDIGSPSQSVEQWLEDFIRDTQEAAVREFWKFWKRPWYLGRISGLKSALDLIRRAKI